MISKAPKHSHFWIEDEVLYETYHTIRGERYMKIMDVPGMPDEDKCSEACMVYVNKQYSQVEA